MDGLERAQAAVAVAKGTWQERLQSEFVDVKTRLDALGSHLRNNSDDMEHKVLQLLRRQQTAMQSYLGILGERLRLHGIAVPGLESDNDPA